MAGSDAGESPREPEVSELMALCLARLSAGAGMGLEVLCEEHPDRAEELRRRMGRLEELGLLGNAAEGGSPLPDGRGPRTVGPFTVSGVLGQGGMGRVYLAQQSHPVRRLVAVKLVHAGLDAERVLERFEAERQAMAVLGHPGICQVLEAGATEEGRPWYAMEYVDGSPLTDFCDERRLGIRDRLELFLQVCDAVLHAHQNGIIHRDLKPTNVLVTGSGGGPRVKVIDFGLAKALSDAERDAPMLTRAGQIVGTPGYMSPEQAGVTGETVDVRTDVYSLGVLLHELLVGRLPLEPDATGSGVVAEMRRLLAHVEPAAPSRRVAEQPGEAAAARGLDRRAWARALSGDLDWIVGRALAKDRRDRYPGVSALADDVRRHLRSEPVLAGPSTRTYRLARLLRRHRREATIAGAGLAGLLVALAVISVQAVRLGDELESFNVLASELEVRELVRVAEEELWPERPERLGAMTAWRREVLEILEDLPVFERVAATLRERGEPAAGGGWAFASARDASLHHHVESLLETLARFGGEDGLLAAVEARADWAAGLVGRTVDAHRDGWDRAIASIADREACPAYLGLALAPQPGLVPLGRDPATGLWEFAFPRPGASLPEGEPGAWHMTGESCLVFVLVPAGTFRQGAQDADPASPGYLPEVARSERDGRLVTLEPFFLSKYEMTQGQWARFTGSNPSYYAPDHPFVAGLEHPVEQVSWIAAERVLSRLGLVLPTGAQWEYAARAGGPAPWWTGPDPVPPAGCANLADESCLAETGRAYGIDDFEEGYDDFFPVHAPVGRFAPNGFGLHDVIGNVWEWCRDEGLDYAEAAPRPGDGLQEPLAGHHEENRTRELRGGSFLSTFVKSRSTFRFYQTMEGANFVFGVRPARRLERGPLR